MERGKLLEKEGTGLATPANRSAAKPGAPARVGRFLREVRAELRKVAWPTRRELTVYTAVVLVATILVAVFLGLIDLLIGQLLRLAGAIGG